MDTGGLLVGVKGKCVKLTGIYIGAVRLIIWSLRAYMLISTKRRRKRGN